MSSMQHEPAGWRQLAELHKGLLSQIAAAEGELQRVECFDEEQRAEIQAILEALRHDCQVHSAYVAGVEGETANA